MRQFEIEIPRFGIKVICALKSPKVADAYMDLVIQGKTRKAMELLFEEVVQNKEEIAPLLEKYPLLKASIVAKIAEALGGVVDAEIREIEQSAKN